MHRKRLLAATGVVAALMAALLISACGGSAKTGSTKCSAGTMKMSDGQVMCKGAMSRTSASGKQTKIDISTGSGGLEVGGQKVVPIQTLADFTWQGMTISAQTRSPIPFLVYEDGRWQTIHPAKHASFHLMVMLNDQHTNAPIAYSSVWATITKLGHGSGGTVIDRQLEQWPMNSEYMGPHYGNDVKLPGSGLYRLTVLVSPPVGAYRESEYKQVWLSSHEVSASFKWNAQTSKATMVGGSGSMATMSMGSGHGLTIDSAVRHINGVSENPAKLVATAFWQQMRIQTLTAAPATYEQPAQSSVSSMSLKPLPDSGSNANLMVELKDKFTGSLLPYATVDATVRDPVGKVVYSGLLHPTISAFYGLYYGSDMKLPGAGRYTAALTIGPPIEGRHIEYAHMWLHPHKLVEHFNWGGK